MTRRHVRYKNSHHKLDEVSDKLDAAAKLAFDFADYRAALQRVFFPLELLSKSAWRYWKVTLGTGLKCWQAPKRKVFLFRYSCIRPLSNVSKKWLNRSPPHAKLQTANTLHCTVVATATSRQKTDKLGCWLPCSPQGRRPWSDPSLASLWTKSADGTTRVKGVHRSGRPQRSQEAKQRRFWRAQ